MSDPNVDEFHGQGGSYEVKDGKRVLVKGSRTEPTDTGGARDHKGEPLAEDLGHQKRPALPEPAAAPWASPEPHTPAPAGVTPIRSRKPAAED